MKTINQYRVIVNLSGDSAIQVPKIVTPAEIRVLRHIHGADAVTRGTRIGVIQTTEEAERERLEAEYGADAVEAVVRDALEATASRLTLVKETPVLDDEPDVVGESVGDAAKDVEEDLVKKNRGFSPAMLEAMDRAAAPKV